MRGGGGGGQGGGLGGWGSVATPSSAANSICNVMQAPYRAAGAAKETNGGGWQAKWPEQHKWANKEGFMVAMAAAGSGGRR